MLPKASRNHQDFKTDPNDMSYWALLNLKMCMFSPWDKINPLIRS